MDGFKNADRIFVAGEWVPTTSNATIDVISPSTETVVGRVPSASKADMDAAVIAARDAFDDGPWPRMTLPERIKAMKGLSYVLARRRDELADVITAQMGCPIAQSRPLQAGIAQVILDSYIELAQQYPFTELRRSAAGSALITHQPVGVVAAVVPWNIPQAVTMHKLAPALLSGCTMVLKPAPGTPLDANLLAEMANEAGLPAGVLNVVPAEAEVSEYLVTHPGVDKVAFTGSTAAGRRIASLCGNDLRRVTLELGGKSAAIILDDADLEHAVETLRMGAFRNSGQVCTLKTRVVVSKRREAELVERLAAMVASMPVGDPFSDSTQIGPMASERHRGVVESYLEIGKAEGALVALGGGRPDLDQGWFVEPTIFTGVDRGMRIAQEEIFGPVVAVLGYDDEDDAVSIANDSRYGLSGAVFTGDPEHGLELARRIRTGTVEINGAFTGWQAPFGGFKDSGLGRESGLEGFDNYVEVSSIGLPAALADTLA